jgi:hypothetical protein
MQSTLRAYVRRHHVALLALFVALTGTATAAVDLGRNSVRSKHIGPGQVKRSDIASNAIDTGKVANGGLIAADFASGQLPRGEPGPPGENATKLFGYIGDAGDGYPGFVYYGSGVTSVFDPMGPGAYYDVTFNRSLFGCVVDAIAGLGSPSGGPPFTATTSYATAYLNGSDPAVARVQFWQNNLQVDTSFMIAAFCFD